MTRLDFGSVALAVALFISAGCAQAGGVNMTAPPTGDYKKVSGLVALPDFIPGLGTLFVNQQEAIDAALCRDNCSSVWRRNRPNDRDPRG